MQSNYKLSVIVPVFNNGLRLFGKCFPSLVRSSMFDEMEIIVVDDGSTDRETSAYESELIKRFNNVRTYRYSDGGSGSASRARNKGIEMASAEYIAFVDPDDELINDGYAMLYDFAIVHGTDFSVGNVQLAARGFLMSDVYAVASSQTESGVYDGDKIDFVKRTKFSGFNIQSTVIKKALIVDNQLWQIEGAIGEDTFFSYQLTSHASRIGFIDLPIFRYYQVVEGSVTNTRNAEFFKKYLPLIKPLKTWLDENALTKEWVELRFNSYFGNYLLRQFSQVPNNEKAECARYLAEYMSPFLPYYDGKNEKINGFLTDTQKQLKIKTKRKEVFNCD